MSEHKLLSADHYVAEILDEIIALRHDIHAHPEMGFEEVRTAELAARKLREYGCDVVVENVGRTGVVGLIYGQGGPGRATVALRADMDALPLTEKTGVAWSSQVKGCMHGCGHDGHVAWALATAYALARTRDFVGTAMIVIQPGEEGFAGGREMIRDGLFTRWHVDEIYAGHGGTDLSVGEFGITRGAMMAAADRFVIEVRGIGGHGGRPQRCVDPIVASAQLILAIQTIVSRTIDPMHPATVSLGSIHAGDEEGVSVIPDAVRLAGTARCMSSEDQDKIERRLNEICEGVGQATGATIKLHYVRMYPALINHEEQCRAAGEIVGRLFGEKALVKDYPASMGAEDFSFMLLERPGAYIRVGLGDEQHTHFPHNPGFDFNDRAIVLAANLFVNLIKSRLAEISRQKERDHAA